MAETDVQFYKNMCLVLQVGYCSNADKKWKKTETRKRKIAEQLEERKAEAVEYEMSLQSTSSDILVDREEDGGIEGIGEEDEYYPPPEEENREKYEFDTKIIDDGHDDMPYKYRHIRHGL